MAITVKMTIYRIKYKINTQWRTKKLYLFETFTYLHQQNLSPLKDINILYGNTKKKNHTHTQANTSLKRKLFSFVPRWIWFIQLASYASIVNKLNMKFDINV